MGGIAGLLVDLDGSDVAGPLYRVEDNDGWSLVVRTDDDLSGVVGQGDRHHVGPRQPVNPASRWEPSHSGLLAECLQPQK